MQWISLNSLDTQLSFGIYYVNFQAKIAKILGKTHNPKVLGADTQSVSLKRGSTAPILKRLNPRSKSMLNSSSLIHNKLLNIPT